MYSWGLIEERTLLHGGSDFREHRLCTLRNVANRSRSLSGGSNRPVLTVSKQPSPVSLLSNVIVIVNIEHYILAKLHNNSLCSMK